LQCVAVCCSVLQCVAVCCSVLQCVAVCCSVLQCVAVCCSVSKCIFPGLLSCTEKKDSYPHSPFSFSLSFSFSFSFFPQEWTIVPLKVFFSMQDTRPEKINMDAPFLQRKVHPCLLNKKMIECE